MGKLFAGVIAALPILIIGGAAIYAHKKEKKEKELKGKKQGIDWDKVLWTRGQIEEFRVNKND